MKYSTGSRVEVVKKSNIIDAIREYVPRVKQDENDKHRYCFDCPICGERDSLVADDVHQSWFCHKCMKGGDVVSLVSYVENESEDKVMELLADKYAVELRRA